MDSQLQALHFLFPHWLLVVFNLMSLGLIWCVVRAIENQATKRSGGSHVVIDVSKRQLTPTDEESFHSNSSPKDVNHESAQLEASEQQQQQTQAPEEIEQQAPQQTQSPVEIEISVHRTKSRAVATQGILLSLIFMIFLGVSSLEVIFEIIAGWCPYWLAQISNAFIAIPGVVFFLVFCHSRDEAKMKTPEGRFVRQFFLHCFYQGWERLVHCVIPAQSKTHVSVVSSTNSW